VSWFPASPLVLGAADMVDVGNAIPEAARERGVLMRPDGPASLFRTLNSVPAASCGVAL
jgi:hypothetical protein